MSNNITPIFDKPEMDEAHEKLLNRALSNKVAETVEEAVKTANQYDQPMPGTEINLSESLSLLMAAHETIADLVKNTACILNREKSHQGATTQNLKELLSEHKTMANQLKDAGANVYESAQALVRADKAIRDSEGRL